MEEKTQDNGHIITTKAAHLTVRSQTTGHQFFTDLTEQRNEQIHTHTHGSPPSRTISGGICCATRVRTNFSTSSLLSTSQMPSQASKMNSQSALIVLTTTSGAARQTQPMTFFPLRTRHSPVTTCSSGRLSVFRLKMKSPNARDKAKLPAREKNTLGLRSTRLTYH